MNKYKNIKIEIDGIIFDSKAEAKRYKHLKKLEDAGDITHLKLQPRFDFKIDNKLMFFYKADFKYCRDDGTYIVEDVKGVRTPIFNLKKKIIEQIYKIEITLI